MSTLQDQMHDSIEQAINGYSVEADLQRQLLTVTYTGDIGVEEARGSFEKVETLLVDMRPAFRMLTDLAELKSMDSACTPYVKQIMDLCDAKGVARVVRVVPDPQKDIGFNTMPLFHYTRAVVIVTCSNFGRGGKSTAGLATWNINKL